MSTDHFRITDNWIEMGCSWAFVVAYRYGDGEPRKMLVVAESIPDAYEVAFSYLNSGHVQGDAYCYVESVVEYKHPELVMQGDLHDLSQLRPEGGES